MNRYDHNSRKRRLALFIMAALCVITLTACTPSSNRDVNAAFPSARPESSGEIGTADYNRRAGESGSWAIYWYLCGSDLESGGGKPGRGGAATLDLLEMLEVTLPDNVTVVIETGGANEWKNDIVSADALERFVYQGSELRRMETLPQASMGDPDTLKDFLDYCNTNYPAEKQAILLWDHGGGSLLGMELDEAHGGDLLTLPELREALIAKPAASGMYELVGFDACLMATVDMVDVLAGRARYMVASEEVEPGTGWDYTGFLTALAENPSQDGAALGKVICDTYYAACEKFRGIAETVTLSVVDLEKAGPLLDAYDAVGQEALLSGCVRRETYFSAFGRAANQSQNYGGGEGKSSPYDMTDLGDLVLNAAELLPEYGSRLLSALNECVIYQVKGKYRDRATGLSCYYHYSADTKAIEAFAQLDTSEAFAHFYDYTLNGKLSPEGEGYVKELASAQAALAPNTEELTPATELSLEGLPLLPGENVLWELNIGARAHDYLSDLYAVRAYMTEDGSRLIMLGYDINFQSDWERGHFRDGFNGMWYAIDGNLIYAWSKSIQFSPTQDSFYQVFESPVLLNTEPYQLVLGMTADMVPDANYGYRAATMQYEILHARRAHDGTDETIRLATKETHVIEPGDIIEPVFPTYYYPGDGTFTGPEWTPYGSIAVTDASALGMEMLGDGIYQTGFLMVDYAGAVYNSEVGWYAIVDNIIRAATLNN